MPGACGRCGRYVGAAEEKLALGKSWHLECFTCAICNHGLDSMTLAEYSELNEIYCKSCYRQFIGPEGYGYGVGPTLVVYENPNDEHNGEEQTPKLLNWIQPPTRLGKSFMRTKIAPSYYGKGGVSKFSKSQQGQLTQSSNNSKLKINNSNRISEPLKTTERASKNNSGNISNPIISSGTRSQSSGNRTPTANNSSKSIPPPPPMFNSNTSSNGSTNKRSTAIPSNSGSGNRSPKNTPSFNKSNSGSSQSRKIPPPPPPPRKTDSSSSSNTSKRKLTPIPTQQSSGIKSPRQVLSSNNTSNGSNRSIPIPPPPPPPPFTRTTSNNSKSQLVSKTPSQPLGSRSRSPNTIKNSSASTATEKIQISSKTNSKSATRLNSSSKSATRLNSNSNKTLATTTDDTECPPLFYCGGKCVGTPSMPRYPPNAPTTRRIPLGPSYGATRTVPKGLGEPCRRCGRPVYLAELQLGYHGAYHTECFKCCACGKKLDSTTVSEHQGEIFCKGCYRRNFATSGVGFGIGAGALQTP